MLVHKSFAALFSFRMKLFQPATTPLGISVIGVSSWSGGCIAKLYFNAFTIATTKSHMATIHALQTSLTFFSVWFVE
jgi:hypothetical protein